MTGREMKERWSIDGIWGERLEALLNEAIANDAYDDAVCSGPPCIGENHIETCPVLIAWQERKAASEKRRGMR